VILQDQRPGLCVRGIQIQSRLKGGEGAAAEIHSPPFLVLIRSHATKINIVIAD